MNAPAGLFTSAVTLASVFVVGIVDAAPPTKDECVETHSRAQDTRDKGQLADAKRLFLQCAQSSCPALIQSDCSKLGEELARAVPSVSFSARDPKGRDLPDTQVFVDESLVTSRLDDGKAYDLDPGKHTVRFVHDGITSTQSVVLAVGERGRNISVTLGEPAVVREADRREAPPPREATSRPLLPLVVAGVGGAALVAGGVLLGVGLGRVPVRCSTWARDCAAPPGDPVFDDASSAVSLANVGLGLGIGGALVGIGGLIWYFTSPRAPAASSAWLVPLTNGRTGAGLRVVF